MNLFKHLKSRFTSLDNRVHCPLCGGSFQQFSPYGGRANARCPECDTLERHRLLWLYFTERVVPWLHKKGACGGVLDIAPTAMIMNRFRNLLGDRYVSAGLQDREHVVEDLFMDITHINQPDRFFDVIICYHVLEHVEDDAKAMSELCGVLKDDGLAIVDVPLLLTGWSWSKVVDDTYEDPSITTPAGRKEAFGAENHFRIYGKDILEKLRAAGFHAEVVWAYKIYSDRRLDRYGFRGEKFFLCTKTATHPCLVGGSGAA